MTGVLDAHLKKSGEQWLVGEKCTYADLAFVPWYWLCPAIMGDGFEKVSFFLLFSLDLFAKFERLVVGNVLLMLGVDRNGSRDIRLAGLGTRSCRLGLLSLKLGRRGRRLWVSTER